MMTTKDLTEKINLLINKAIGSGLSSAQIQAALTAQQTALSTLSTAPTQDRTIVDPGPALNPSQP